MDIYNIINIERRICIEPQYLDSEIESHLLNKIKKVTKNECSKEYGYILEVLQIIEIKNNNVSSANSDIVFTVIFEAKTLLPNIGNKYSGKILLILPESILLVIIHKRLRSLIPVSNLQDYIYNGESKQYHSKNNPNKILMIGNTVCTKIVGMKYNKQTFSCFGTLDE